MEVHHHSHHPKKIKEYISEFLMLFLAVTLGFFAENIREHYVEKEREEKFIKIVHEDLLNDINALDKIKFAYDIRLKREDTLINILSNPNYSQTNDLYYLARLNSIREFFHHSKNGFQQLKNAGGLRLIEDIDIIKKIQEYENSIDEMEELQQLTENLLMVYREKMSVIFKGVVFKDMPQNSSAVMIADRFKRPVNNPSLMSTNPSDINELLIKTLYVHNNNLGILNRSKKLYEEALLLDNTLRAHYNINK
jgi:hypothetical protein